MPLFMRLLCSLAWRDGRGGVTLSLLCSCMTIHGCSSRVVGSARRSSGPLYFCCGLQSIVDRISALGPTYQKWYVDDGGIVG